MTWAPVYLKTPVRFAFSNAADGDLRGDLGARRAFAGKVEAPYPWAEVRQVHGWAVVHASHPGHLGEADALWTDQPSLALGIFVADCAAVIIESESAVGVAHAGWRGTAAGVLPELLAEMRAHGHQPLRAHVSPFIRACCFEVGPEVSAQLAGFGSISQWKTRSIDLGAAAVFQLGIPTELAEGCTFHDEAYLSHRRMSPLVGAEQVGRMAALAWLEPR